jgi:hypothetical protein
MLKAIGASGQKKQNSTTRTGSVCFDQPIRRSPRSRNASISRCRRRTSLLVPSRSIRRHSARSRRRPIAALPQFRCSVSISDHLMTSGSNTPFRFGALTICCSDALVGWCRAATTAERAFTGPRLEGLATPRCTIRLCHQLPARYEAKAFCTDASTLIVSAKDCYQSKLVLEEDSPQLETLPKCLTNSTQISSI